MDIQNKTSSITQLFDTVVSGGYCIGCGACAALEGSPINIGLDSFGRLVAQKNVSDGDEALSSLPVADVCPFSNYSKNEDELGKSLFGQNAQYRDKLGYHISTYAGYVKESGFRSQGSSGGMGSWIACTMLAKGMIDGVIHVKQKRPTEDDPRLFYYNISTTAEEVGEGAKSKYYPVELSEVIHFVRNNKRKYLLVGVPCFIKAVRLLSNQDPIIKERVAYCVGLVCGHLKSSKFAEMFSWQCGIAPRNLLSIDFRTKLEGFGANQYGVTVTGYKGGQQVRRVSPPVNTMYGTNWGLGFFKYQACDYCDDVVAETADITIGDAWLPQYVGDGLGTNIIIVRNPLIQSLVEDAERSGKINLDLLSPDDVIESQRAGFYHRREGLAYRLLLKDKQSQWRPRKRVSANSQKLSRKIRRRFRLREIMAEESHIGFKKAVEANNFSVFEAYMAPIVTDYYRQYAAPLWRRIGSDLKKHIKKIFRINIV
ncbi:Coenzyme F420 hydrogenase/dehydrogenase, beta subunit C-terminal domain [Olivibacter sp. CPCC 100613]|uniref:Coenzyme F420 hydrogenase/dehydrogenase, beta subunit C-terminal domain n=1 Tax=Olivibacter sp. CPCC 100613 TaxID=3079931 RepID=UPI002FF64024